MQIHFLIEKNYETISSNMDIEKINNKLTNKECLVIMENNLFCNLISAKSLNDNNGSKVQSLNDLPKIQKNQEIIDVLNLMLQENQEYLPVFDNEQFLGIVSKNNLENFITQYEKELHIDKSNQLKNQELIKINSKLKSMIKEKDEELVKKSEQVQLLQIENNLNELSLKESGKWYQDIFETMSECLVFVNEYDIIIYGNNNFFDMLGYKRSEIVGKEFALYIAENSIENYLKHFSKRFDEQNNKFEIEIYNTSNKLLSFIVSSITVENWKNNFAGCLLIFTDITEKKKLQTLLEQQNERFKLAIKSSRVVIWEWDIQFNNLKINQDQFESNGYDIEPSDNLNIESFLDLIHPNDIKQVKKKLTRCLRGLSNYYENEHRTIARNGSIRWILDQAQLVTDDQQNPVKMIGCTKDITEKKIIVEALKESEEKYRILIENANDLIFIIQNNYIVFSNLKVYQVTGYTEIELIDTSILNLIHENDRVKFNTEYNQILTSNFLFPPKEYKFVTKYNLTRWMDCNIIKIEWKKAEALIIFARDITSRKLAEQEIQQLTIRKKELEKEIKRLMTRLQNNIRNKLEATKHIIDLALEAPKKDDKSESLNYISKVITYCSNKTKNMMFVTMNQNCTANMLIDELKLRTNLMFNDTLIEYELIINNQLYNKILNVELVYSLLDIYTELLSNIQKHSFANQIKIKLIFNELKVKITFCDNGVGFNQNNINGDGLGFKMIKQITSQMNGSYRIKSSKNKGSIIKVVFKL